MKRLVSLSVLLVLVLGTVAVAAQVPMDSPSTGPAPSCQIENVTGSTVNSVAPAPLPTGIQFKLCFNVTFTSNDGENMFGFDARLPGNWTVGPLYDVPGTGEGCGHYYGFNPFTKRIYWYGKKLVLPEICGDWAPGTYDFCVDVTVSANCGGSPWSLKWRIRGDKEGAEPHTVFGATSVACFPTPAYGLDVYGSQLVRWPDLAVPGTWKVRGPVPDFHPAADFLGTSYDYLYALDFYTNEFVKISTDDGTRMVVGTSIPIGLWAGMTSTADGTTLYASSSDCGTQSYLYTVDTSYLPGLLTLKGPMRNGSCMIAIAIDAAGKMYGVDLVDNTLYLIDTNDGHATAIGPTGITANYAQGMDFDLATGTLYWAAYNNGLGRGELRTIDTQTGLSSLVGPFPGGNEVDGLAIETAPPGAPTLTCGEIDHDWAIDPYGRLLIRWYVQAIDQDGDPVVDVKVDAYLTKPGDLALFFVPNKPTNVQGFAHFVYASSIPDGTWTIDVDDMTYAGHTFKDGPHCSAEAEF